MYDGFMLTREQHDVFCRLVGWPKTYREAVREVEEPIMKISLPFPMDIRFGDHRYNEVESEEYWFECGHVTVIIESVRLDSDECIVVYGKRGHDAGKLVKFRFQAGDPRGNIIIGDDDVKRSDDQDMLESQRHSKLATPEDGIQDP